MSGALNKKNLEVSRSALNLIAFINYFTASLILAIFLYFQHGSLISEVGNYSYFWTGIVIVAIFNTLGAYYGYRAIHLAEFNYISPWLAATSIIIIIPSFLILGEKINSAGFLGIILVVAGAFLIDFKKRTENQSEKERIRRTINNKAKVYALIMGVCYTITPVGMKMAIIESSPIFVAVLAHLSIALCFLVIILLFQRKNIFGEVKVLSGGGKKIFYGTALAAGLGYAISNGSVNVALAIAPVSLVMAVKRIAPVFSFFIGYLFFKEKNDARKKFMATILIAAGVIIVAIFR